MDALGTNLAKAQQMARQVELGWLFERELDPVEESNEPVVCVIRIGLEQPLRRPPLDTPDSAVGARAVKAQGCVAVVLLALNLPNPFPPPVFSPHPRAPKALCAVWLDEGSVGELQAWRRRRACRGQCCPRARASCRRRT